MHAQILLVFNQTYDTVVMEIFVSENFCIFNFCIDYFRSPIKLPKKIIVINVLRKLQVLIAKHLYAIPLVKVYLTLG